MGSVVSCLPNIISYVILLTDHGHLEVLDKWSIASVGTIWLYLYTVDDSVSIKYEAIVFWLYVGLCGYDMLYRANLAYNVLLGILSIKFIVSRKLYKVHKSN